MKAFAVAACIAVCSLRAFAFCDHPGTPNPVQAWPLNATTVELLITNTAKEGATRTIVYEVEDKAGKVLYFNAMLPAGEAIPYDIPGLAANTTYTYRVWTRDDNKQGCRSEQPSGWVTATTKAPFHYKVYLPGDSGPCAMLPDGGCVPHAVAGYPVYLPGRP